MLLMVAGDGIGPASQIGARFGGSQPHLDMSIRLYIGIQGELPLDQSLVFDDRLFDGRPYELVLRYLAEDLSGSWDERPLLLIVSALTEEYFLYEQTRKLHKSVRENVFAEPVPVFTNVENGQGIFAGYTNVITRTVIQRGKDF